MPNVAYVVFTQGWGETKEEARDNARRRLNSMNTDIQAGREPLEQNSASEVIDGGNGGPCEARDITRNHRIDNNGLPEFENRPSRPRPDNGDG